jgi:hypothetical protein
MCGPSRAALISAAMASDGADSVVNARGGEDIARSRSPARADPSSLPTAPLPLQLVNLPEQGPNVYTYHHGPESDIALSVPLTQHGHASVWDPRGGGSFSLRLTSTGTSSDTVMIGPSEAVPGGAHGVTAPGNALPGAGGLVGGGGGDGGGAPDGGNGGNGGGGPPAWDESACSLHSFPGSSPVTVRFAEVVHWRQRVVYCRADCTVDHVKWAMKETVGQHISTFRIGDGFSGHPLARHWRVTGLQANQWQNFQEPRRVLVVMPSFM